MPHLPRALQSLAAQTLQDFEVVMVDDASTDASRAEMARWAARDARFRIVALSHQGGVARALAAGCHAARGALLARLDADDEAHAQRLARQVRFLDAHPGVAAVGAAAAIADLSAPPARPRRIAAQPICARLVRYRLALSCCLIHPTVTVRRDALLRAGGYSPFAAPHAEDYSLWLRLAGLGGPLRAAPLQLCNLPDVLVALGKHDRNVSRVHAAEQAASSAAAVRGAILAMLPPTPVKPRADAISPDDVTLDAVRALQRPDQAKSAADLHRALRILLVLKRLTAAEGGCEEAGEGEISIDADVQGRAGEISSLAITKFQGDPDSVRVWRTWLQAQQARDGETADPAAGLRSLFAAMRS